MKLAPGRNDFGAARGDMSRSTGVPAQTASSFPEKIVRIIVSFRAVARPNPGAAGRGAAERRVRPGGGGREHLRRRRCDRHRGRRQGRRRRPHAADGTGTTTTLLPHLRSDLPYDPQRDLAAVTLIATFPTVGGASRDPGDGRESLIALVRAAPGKFSYASPASAPRRISRPNGSSG